MGGIAAWPSSEAARRQDLYREIILPNRNTRAAVCHPLAHHASLRAADANMEAQRAGRNTSRSITIPPGCGSPSAAFVPVRSSPSKEQRSEESQRCAETSRSRSEELAIASMPNGARVMRARRRRDTFLPLADGIDSLT